MGSSILYCPGKKRNIGKRLVLAIGVTVVESLHIDLIDDGILVPESVIF